MEEGAVERQGVRLVRSIIECCSWRYNTDRQLLRLRSLDRAIVAPISLRLEARDGYPRSA